MNISKNEKLNPKDAEKMDAWNMTFPNFLGPPYFKVRTGCFFFQGKGYILNLEKSRFTREDSPTAQPTEAYTKVDDYIHVGRQGGKAQPWGVLVGPVTRGKTTVIFFWGGGFFPEHQISSRESRLNFNLSWCM